MITELVHEMSLQRTAVDWAKQILQDCSKAQVRQSRISELRGCGYDESETIVQRMKMYKNEFYGTE